MGIYSIVLISEDTRPKSTGIQSSDSNSHLGQLTNTGMGIGANFRL